MNKFDRIVLNVPHASMEGLYDKELSGWGKNANFLNQVVLKWTDLYTDFIFGEPDDERIEMVRGKYSRFIVDFERLKDDPKEAEGEGIVYGHYGSWERTGLTAAMKERLTAIWQAYHEELLHAANQANTLLIDCHSFPSDFCKEIDICIGFNEDYTKPSQELLDAIVNHFKSYGYRVGVNIPYSNAIDPARNCGITHPEEIHYKSVMIEVNKHTYLDEHQHTINVNSHYAPILSNAIKSLYRMLLN